MSSQSNSYHIGQVLYVISSKSLEIIPLIVYEQVNIKTLNGDKTNWTAIIGPPGDKRKIVDLSKIKETKFDSLEKAKNHLMRNFEVLVNNAIQNTIKNQNEWYNSDLSKTKNNDDVEQLEMPSSSALTDSTSVPPPHIEAARDMIREALQDNEE